MGDVCAMASAERQSPQTRERITHKKRSTEVKRGRVFGPRCRTQIWCRSAGFPSSPREISLSLQLIGTANRGPCIGGIRCVETGGRHDLQPCQNGRRCICGGIALNVEVLPTSLASRTPRNPRERPEYSRCAAFVMMVQATQLSYFDNRPSIGGCVLRGSGASLANAK